MLCLWLISASLNSFDNIVFIVNPRSLILDAKSLFSLLNTFNLFSGMGSTVVDQGINTAGDMADIACLGNEVRNIYENADMDNEANTHQTEAAIEQQQIDTEKTRIETLLQAAQAELKSVTEAEKSAIQSSAPAYVG